MSNGKVIQAAVRQAERFVRAGADILDLGGESTRPGSTPLDADEELERVLPVIKALRHADLDTIISIDTYKAKVADAVVRAGADWINDVWALRGDPEMAHVVSHHGVPVILIHNRSKPNGVQLDTLLGGSYIGSKYENLLEDVKKELLVSVKIARKAHIGKDRIILDPGLGFGKSVSQNLELINCLPEIKAMGFPVLLGPSRKSFIGRTLDLPVDQRVEGTGATVAVGIVRGADIVRVHDVEVMIRVARMTDAIIRN